MTGPAAPDVLDLFRRHVARDPSAPALARGDHVLDYRATDRLTDAWARRLAERGAGPEGVVGLAFTGARETVLGMLATLKCGAAFTVLDARLPPAARADVVRRVGAVTWAGDGPHAPPGSWTPDTGPEAGGPDPGAGPPPPDRMAYVLFTSGSTGRPKGIVVERGALAAFSGAVAARLGLGPGDRWLQIASLAFDVVIEEVFPALAVGAAVVCRDDDRTPEPAELHELIERTGSTVVELSTQYWREYAHWLRAGGHTTPECLRRVVVGGERMDPGPYRAWQVDQPARLVHVYGLTECTVSSTMYDDLLPADADEVPLGRPLDGVEITVRRDGVVLPAGETGEIHVGGALLARGFLDDPAATADRYPPDPVAAGPGARVHRTGDVGRIGRDGLLRFAGRVDDQLKIRGHRVEPGAVERALCERGGAAHAVVVPDPDTGTTLWAFVVPADPGAVPPPGRAVRRPAPERARLAAELGRTLPEWSVPAVVHDVAALPTTAHGKVDRERLNRWARERRPVLPDPAVPAEPGGSLSTVTRLFRTVLDAPDLGPDDDFFEHGGQSLLAMRLLAEVRASFGDTTGLRASTLFAHPTPRRLDAVLAGRAAPGRPD